MVIWKLGYVILLLLLSMKCEMKAPNLPEDSFHVDHKGKQGRICGPSKRQWTIEEDEALRKAVEHYERKNWKKIAECLKNRTDVQCLHRWQKVLHPELVKGPWSKEEDNKIIALVEKHGPKKWSTISQHLPGRIGKQCRERWHNHLNPAINKNAWTQEEELILVRAHQIYGNKWAELTKFLPGRSDNSIKNHWNSSVKKNLDSYYSSGVLDQYQSLPLIAFPNKSLVSSSSWMQSKGDESNSRSGGDAEESECSQYLNDLPEEIKPTNEECCNVLFLDSKTSSCDHQKGKGALCYESGNIPALSSSGLRDLVLFYNNPNDSTQDHELLGATDTCDGFIDIDEHVTSHGNEGNDSVLEHHELSSYIPNDSLKLLPLDSFSSPTKVTKVFSSPFFNCDLVSLDNEVRQEYSPFGLRQLMNSPILKLWDSHVLDIRKEKKLKRALASSSSAKDFSHLDVVILDEGDDCKSSCPSESPSKAKVSRDSASARLNRELNSVYEEPKVASESGGVTSTENDQETSESLIEIGLCSPDKTGFKPYSKVDTSAKDSPNQHKSFNIEDFSIFDGTPFTKLLDSTSQTKSPSLFGSLLTSPKSPQDEDVECLMSTIGLMNKKSIQGKENKYQSHEQLVHQSQVEQRTLDFSDCETPRKASPGGYSNSSSYLLKSFR